jgi:hypothetical protein
VTERHETWPVPAPPRGYIPPHFTPERFGAPPPAPFQGLPPRPVYREAHAIRAAHLLAGLAAGALWCALFAGLSHSLLTYAWWTVAATVSAWFAAAALAIFGDRGVATGVAIMSGLALSVAMGIVAAEWIHTYNWPLW